MHKAQNNSIYNLEYLPIIKIRKDIQFAFITSGEVVMFKSVFTAAIVIAATTSGAHAAEFINKDGSALSDQCIAAALSGKVAQNVSANVQCNGLSIAEFAKQYRENRNQETTVTFERNDNKPETILCIAAATSNEAFSKAVARTEIRHRLNNVACNGIKLKEFAKQYNSQFGG